MALEFVTSRRGRSGKHEGHHARVLPQSDRGRSALVGMLHARAFSSGNSHLHP